MTQPAKVQEPSMEEILASIRRIIADDNSKPAADPAPVAKAEPRPAAAPKVEPPRAEAPRAAPPAAPPRPEVKAAPAKPAEARRDPPPPPAAAASNNQDDIDAMLASLDGPSAGSAVAAADPEPEVDVFDLTESMAMPPRTPAFRTIDPQNDLEFDEVAAAPEPAPAPPAPRAAPPREAVREPTRVAAPSPVDEERPAQPLLSHSTVAAVDSAFNSLAHTVFAQNARTLEDLVKEMLRPMLKSWLDDNLPQVVERMVRAEIERVSRGR